MLDIDRPVTTQDGADECEGGAGETGSTRRTGHWVLVGDLGGHVLPVERHGHGEVRSTFAGQGVLSGAGVVLWGSIRYGGRPGRFEGAIEVALAGAGDPDLARFHGRHLGRHEGRSRVVTIHALGSLEVSTAVPPVRRRRSAEIAMLDIVVREMDAFHACLYRLGDGGSRGRSPVAPNPAGGRGRWTPEVEGARIEI